MELINDEDAKVAQAVRRELPHVARAVDCIVARLERGGSLIYIEAPPASWRAGRSRVPPTFNTPPGQVVARIAGGERALRESIVKLRRRAQRIVAPACGLSMKEAASLLTGCDGETKTAIVVGLTGVTPDEARRRLADAEGRVRAALRATT